MSTLHTDAERGGTLVADQGRAGRAARALRAERVAGAERALTTRAGRTRWPRSTGSPASALRTLAVAYRRLPQAAPPAANEEVERDLVYLGLVGIIDPPREEARAAIAEAQGAGIRIMMITGDHPRTAGAHRRHAGHRRARRLGADGRRSRVARRRGAAHAGARRLGLRARRAGAQAARSSTRCRPTGHRGAMTGDGVNDAPALKTADIGVAMGITGTDVTKEAADMILADDNFATIVTAVREGRGIFANIRKFLRFLLSSNMGEVLTMFLGVVLAGVLGLQRPRRGGGGAAARDPDPLDQPAHRHGAGARDGRRPAARRRHAAPAAPPQRPRHRRAACGRGVSSVGARDGARHRWRRSTCVSPEAFVGGSGDLDPGAHDGLHDARAGAALQLLQRPLGDASAPSTTCSRTGGSGAPSRSRRRCRSRSCTCPS